MRKGLHSNYNYLDNYPPHLLTDSTATGHLGISLNSLVLALL